MDDEFDRVCRRLPLAAESLDSRGIYILDDGFRIVVWFGRMLPPDLARNLVEEDSATDFSKVCTLYTSVVCAYNYIINLTTLVYNSS